MQPIPPPSASAATDDTSPKIGVSVLGFSADGSYLATKEDSMPTAVWIWDLAQQCCCAVLLQHSVVKKLLWHPTDPNNLLIQCIQGESVLYSWNALEAGPRVLSIPSVTFSGKAEAHWVPKASHKKPQIMFGDHRGFVIAYPEGRDEVPSPNLEAERDSDQHSNVESENDSVYDALTGKKDTPFAPVEDLNTAQAFPEDTFHYRRGVKAQ